MKIQLDTEARTIKLESRVKLSKLIDTLNKLLPNNEWKGFTLETNTTIEHWSSPIHIHDHYPRPYWQPWYTTSYASSNNALNLQVANNEIKASSQNQVLTSGKFNIEL